MLIIVVEIVISLTKWITSIMNVLYLIQQLLCYCIQVFLDLRLIIVFLIDRGFMLLASSPGSKVGCVFPMIISSEFRMGW